MAGIAVLVMVGGCEGRGESGGCGGECGSGSGGGGGGGECWWRGEGGDHSVGSRFSHHHFSTTRVNKAEAPQTEPEITPDSGDRLGDRQRNMEIGLDISQNKLIYPI